MITRRVTLKERRLVELVANVKLNTLSHFRHIKEQLTIAHYWECIDTTRSGSIRTNIHTLVTCNTKGTYFQSSCIIHFTVTGFVTATTLVLLTVGLKAHGKWVRPWWWFSDGTVMCSCDFRCRNVCLAAHTMVDFRFRSFSDLFGLFKSQVLQSYCPHQPLSKP